MDKIRLLHFADAVRLVLRRCRPVKRRKKSKQPKPESDEPESVRNLPMNRIVINLDKALRKTRDPFDQGKLDEARKAFENADYWQAKIDSPT